MQAYQNQQQTPGLEDMKEFNQIIKERSPLIKKSILGISNIEPKEEDKLPSKIEQKLDKVLDSP